MKPSLVILTSIVVLFCCCNGTKSVTAADLAKVEELIASKKMEIVSQWASPMLSTGVMAISNSGLLAPGSTAGRIDLSGNANYLKIEGDTVSAYLPYYGERQMGGGYNSKSGVEFKGAAQTFEVTKNEKNSVYVIRFTVKEQTENYQVFINLFPDLSTTISVNSSQRDAIMYYGNAKPIIEKQ